VYLAGEDQRALPWSKRRQRLDRLSFSGPAWCTVSVLPGPTVAMLTAAVEQGLEGVVAKRMTSRYLSRRRSSAWLKVKTEAWRRDHAPRRHEVR
jgi:bifunctional non-homologous end joining protein LigD